MCNKSKNFASCVFMKREIMGRRINHHPPSLFFPPITKIALNRKPAIVKSKFFLTPNIDRGWWLLRRNKHLIQINVNGRQDTFQGAARHAYYTYPSQPEGLPVNRSKYRRNDAITHSVVNTYLKLVDLYVCWHNKSSGSYNQSQARDSVADWCTFK